MRIYSKLGWLIGWLAVAIIIGGAIGLLVSRQSATPKIDLPPTTPEITVTPETNTADMAQAHPTNIPESTPTTEPPPAPATWDVQLDDILVSNDDPGTKSSKLLALLQTTPDENKEDVAHHLVNMTEDENYSGVAELLINTNTLASVQTVLMNDLLNRDNQVKLPVLLAIARNENHTMRAEAKDVLELYLQEDKGSNWDDWAVAVDNFLKENQDQQPQ